VVGEKENSMTTLNRNPNLLIGAIRQAQEKWPDMRVGQLIDNALQHARNKSGRDVDLFYVENDVLARYISEFMKET
jgi:hypothetical protein